MKLLCGTICRLPSLVRASNTFSTMATPRRLEGKVAIVTASTEGIGFAVAKRLGLEGASVVISSRKQQNVDRALEELKNENLKVYGMVCHVGKHEHRKKLIDETVKQFGGLDILISNAASNPTFGPILDTSEDAWDKIFDTNVKAAFFLCKEAIPFMEKRGGGNIVMVSSIGGYMPFELIAPYSVSKTALLGLTKALAPQCATKNIRVNCIAPGLIKTKFSQAMWQDRNIEMQATAHIPQKRIGLPEECAGAVAFLASDDASYVTGETLVISGGAPSRL